MARARTAPVFGALLGPGVPGGANTASLPARRSRTSDASASRVYPVASAAWASEAPSNR
jgi:hypothetical protein